MRSNRYAIASRIGRLTAAGLLAITGTAAIPVASFAANFQVSPVMLTLLAKRPVGSLTIANGDIAPVAIKVSTYRWTQVDGKDVYTPTDDLIASPPIFTTPAQAKQLVRVGLRRRVANAAYRVMLEEIPAPTTDRGIRIAINLNLPLYVVDDPAAKAVVRWSAWRDAQGGVVIEGRNTGGAAQQVTAITLTNGATPSVLTTAMGVVLPASMRRWTVGAHPELATGTLLHLSVRTADGEDKVTAALSAR